MQTLGEGIISTKVDFQRELFVDSDQPGSLYGIVFLVNLVYQR